MNMITTTVARVLFAIPLAIFGIFHFMHASAMAGMVPVPGGEIWMYITGVGFIAAAIAFITGFMARIAALLLALMLLIFVLSIHLMPAIDGNQDSMIALLKDVLILSGALAFANMFAGIENASPTSISEGSSN